MSAEHQRQPEHQERHEKSHELDAAANEQRELLRDNPEASKENSTERADAAREVINKVEPAEESAPTDEGTHKVSSFLNHKLNYADTLASVQRKLSPMSRNFSKVIHAPIVEKTSEALEKTVARPSVTLGATWTALIVGSLFYFVARHYGYALSGSEITFSFIVGAVLGLCIEAVWRSLARKRA